MNAAASRFAREGGFPADGQVSCRVHEHVCMCKARNIHILQQQQQQQLARKANERSHDGRASALRCGTVCAAEYVLCRGCGNTGGSSRGFGTARSTAAQPPACRCHKPTPGFQGYVVATISQYSVDAGVSRTVFLALIAWLSCPTVCWWSRLFHSRSCREEPQWRRRRCRSREWAAAKADMVYPPIPSTERALPYGIHWLTEPQKALLSFQVRF